MTAGFFSPLPPARTGVADYSEALLAYLRAHGNVEVGAAKADVNLYHLGNNQLHAGIYERALRNPGVIVLHDGVLHHFLLGLFTRTEYVDEFIYNYGDWSRGLAESLWRTRARSAADHRYFSYPMLKRICETSRAVIVHNPAAAAMVRRHAGAARVIEIPMLVEPADSAAADIEEVRRSLNVAHGAQIAAIFGHLRESKRLMAVLRVFRRLPAGRMVLLLVGEIASADLIRAVSIFERDAHVRRLPYTPKKQFRRLANATDVCINLRYPAAGETSAITMGLMGAGKPVIVTEGVEVSRLPPDTCVRVRSGLGEETELEEVLLWLSGSRQHARDIGSRAARYVQAHHSPEAVSRLYWNTLCDARS